MSDGRILPWRSRLLDSLAAELLRRADRERILVAVDGVDGSGKTTFADELRRCIATVRPVVVIHLDDFLNPRAVRHARGRDSPKGFWLDSYDYETIERWVLDPLGSQGDGWYRPASYDVRGEHAVDSAAMKAPNDAVVLVEGMFLHRDGLASRWGASLLLDVPFVETARRMARRDGSSPDPSDPAHRRYVEGQRLYFRECRPWLRATWVVDNADVAGPKLIHGDDSFAARDSAA